MLCNYKNVTLKTTYLKRLYKRYYNRGLIKFWTFFNGDSTSNCDKNAACRTNAIDIKSSGSIYMYGVKIKSNLNIVGGVMGCWFR